VRIITPPGVFRPLSDTRLIADQAWAFAPGARVLDVCTGTGHLAVAAALAGARRVVAVDVSRRAVLAARLNARLNGVRVDVRRGDLLAPVGGERFDLVISNPPYLPATNGEIPARGPARARDAGSDGRALLDRLIAGAPRVLAPGGTLLLVHSSVCGETATLAALAAAGLRPRVMARRRGPLGPQLTARAPVLEARGLLPDGRHEEELLVICATRPAKLLNQRRPDALIHTVGRGA
jgi:release factor glutamine methyltransferase